MLGIFKKLKFHFSFKFILNYYLIISLCIMCIQIANDQIESRYNY